MKGVTMCWDTDRYLSVATVGRIEDHHSLAGVRCYPRKDKNSFGSNVSGDWWGTDNKRFRVRTVVERPSTNKSGSRVGRLSPS